MASSYADNVGCICAFLSVCSSMTFLQPASNKGDVDLACGAHSVKLEGAWGSGDATTAAVRGVASLL